MAKQKSTPPATIRFAGATYRLKESMKDPSVSSAWSLLNTAKRQLDSATKEDEIAQAKANLADAAQSLLAELS